MADTATELEPAGVIDVQELRDLLSLLQEFKVAAFQMGPLAISFKDPDEFEGGFTPARGHDDGHSTSSKRVDGFSAPFAGPIHKHPSLWPHQNGKTLKFDGSLE